MKATHNSPLPDSHDIGNLSVAQIVKIPKQDDFSLIHWQSIKFPAQDLIKLSLLGESIGLLFPVDQLSNLLFVMGLATSNRIQGTISNDFQKKDLPTPFS